MDYQTLSWTELLVLVRQRDPEAVAEMHRRTVNHVERAAHVSRLAPEVHSEYATDDAVQSGYVRLLGSDALTDHEFATQEDLERYLIRIIRNRIYDRQRRAHNHDGTLRRVPVEADEFDPAQPETLNHRDDWELLAREIPADVLEMLRMRAADEDLTWQALGTIFGEPWQTLYARYKAALRAFQEFLRRRGEGPAR